MRLFFFFMGLIALGFGIWCAMTTFTGNIILAVIAFGLFIMGTVKGALM